MMELVKETMKFLIYGLLLSVVIFLYMKISSDFIEINNFKLSDMKRLEIPLLLMFIFIFYLPSKNKFILMTLMSTILIILLFLIYDIFYFFLSRSVQLSDFINATMIWDFSPTLSLSLLIAFIIIIASITYPTYIVKHDYSIKVFSIVLASKILLITGIFYYTTTTKFEKSLLKRFQYIPWSQARTIKKNGRFSSFIYYSFKSNKAKEQLNQFKSKKIDVNKLLFNNKEITNTRNIYIVVLESFIDPRLLLGIKFEQSPLYPGLKEYLYNNNFSHVISPVYGGDTAQAEFEILTGVKAYSKVNSIEFNVLEGNLISGFINYLKQNNYDAHGVIASNAGFFNSKTAYKSIGFDKITFLEEAEDFKKNPSDKIVFDGDLFQYNLTYLKQNRLKTPYIFYSLGMFGHHPYNRNYKARPDKVEVKSKHSKIKKITNQFYYRTEALTFYLNELLQLDPNSIILVTSDHLPSLLTKKIKYSLSKKINIALLLIDGKTININGLKQYQLPQIILAYLNSKKSHTIIPISNNIMLDIYYKMLSQSLK